MNKKWNLMLKHRKFFDEFAKDAQLKNPQEWGKITIKQIKSKGGSSILNYYQDSLFKALKETYRGKYKNDFIVKYFQDINWKIEWFPKVKKEQRKPKNFWMIEDNQRMFLDKLAKNYNITKPEEWGQITFRQIIEKGGKRIIDTHHSLFQALRTLYPNTKWNRDWFYNLNNHPFNYWNNKTNQLTFLETIASEFHIQNPKDWGKVTHEHIIQRGGKALLYHFNGSLFKCLQSVYNDTVWKREWFINISLYPSSFWKVQENQRNFLDKLASQYHLEKPEDWKRISISLIRKKGGEGLLRQYEHSLQRALSSNYPHINWNDEKNLNISEPQHTVMKYSKRLFPGLQNPTLFET